MRFSAFLFVSVLIVFCSCKKNSDSVTLTPNFYIINGGAADTDKALLLFSSSDTLVYNVVISSTYFLPSSALISIGVSDELRASYNSTYNTSYEAMPANAYSFKDTITAGVSSLYDTIPVYIYKHALTDGKPYMLPIQFVSTGGYTADATASVIYLHTSNNILSGIYNATGTKVLYNGDAADSNINTKSPFTLNKSLTPSLNNTSLLDYADLGPNGWQYIIGFSKEDSSFFALPNTVIQNSIQAGSFKVISAMFDSTSKNIYIKTSYKNLSGDERIVEESLTLQ
ncbi:MAG: DUF1735 domain-containing protein [Parafilimonas sp.]|nr:DUF1735 domain-containing protein [Parafilimonas sp.]